LWRRAKKSELIEETFTKAGDQASGFENGIRAQFRQILGNKKKLRGFNQEEVDAMRKIVRGGTLENAAKMMGRFGLSEGQASNMLLGSLGAAGGFAAGGVTGAIAVPLVGQLSRILAQKLTRNNGRAADLIVRAGNNGEQVVKAYFRAIPAKERSAQELTQLLLRPNIAFDKIKLSNLDVPDKRILSDAVFLTSAINNEKDQ